MSNYRKLIAAGVGIVVLLVKNYSGVDLGPVTNDIVELSVGLLTLASVYWFPNTKKA